MILATTTGFSDHDMSVSRNHSSDSVSNRRANPLSLAKTVGVLALALSGGARTAHAAEFQGNRRLLTDAADYSSSPFDYDSFCKNGTSVDSYPVGTNFEDCTAQESAQISAIKAGLKNEYNRASRCFKVSGYLAAALFGAGTVAMFAKPGTAEESRATVGTFCGTGFVSMIPVTVCGAISGSIEGRLEKTLSKAEDCCKIFPTKEELLVLTQGSNNTSASAPIPADGLAVDLPPR